MRVMVIHLSDGYIISRDVDEVPSVGDWISLGSDTYVVKQRIWDYADARTVRLMVEEPKD